VSLTVAYKLVKRTRLCNHVGCDKLVKCVFRIYFRNKIYWDSLLQQIIFAKKFISVGTFFSH